MKQGKKKFSKTLPSIESVYHIDQEIVDTLEYTGIRLHINSILLHRLDHEMKLHIVQFDYDCKKYVEDHLEMLIESWRNKNVFLFTNIKHNYNKLLTNLVLKYQLFNDVIFRFCCKNDVKLFACSIMSLI